MRTTTFQKDVYTEYILTRESLQLEMEVGPC